MHNKIILIMVSKIILLSHSQNISQNLFISQVINKEFLAELTHLLFRRIWQRYQEIINNLASCFRPLEHLSVNKKVLLIIIVLLLLQTQNLFAQFYNGYQMNFGKNRVQYEDFEWQFYRLDRFDTYYYVNGSGLAQFASNVAEKR